MNGTRKKIIINEISQWKKNHLLPEHYCDFLLALYTEGNQQEELKKEKKIQRIWKNQYLFLFLIPISLFFIHFTELPINLQMTFATIFVLAGIIYAIYYSRKGILLQLPLIASALILLFSSVEFVSRLHSENPIFLYFTLVINCVLWLVTGWRLKLLSFTISGVLGMILLLIYIFI